MSKSRSVLKKQNSSSRSDRHLAKYQELEGPSLDSDRQLVIDIGSLSEIDPKNIKELSRLMSEKFETMLHQELEAVKRGTKPPSDPPVLKVDLTQASGRMPGLQVRDERFSLDTFYNAARQSDGSYTTTQEESESGLHQRHVFRAPRNEKEDNERISIIKEEFRDESNS
jgi:hypothetical protein